MRFGGFRVGGLLAAMASVLGIGAGADAIARQALPPPAMGPLPPQLGYRPPPLNRRRSRVAGPAMPAGSKLARKAAEGKL